jgi:Na+-transporting NADH:ubiquinone oxidoreductase subunit B
MASETKKQPLLMKQKPMFQVVYALLPLVGASVYLFGWRSLVVLLVVNLFGFLSEYAFARIYKQQVSSAVFVTNFLFALSLPPAIPLWIAAVGIVFGIVFGKMVFGGFGRNVFNPAISGRAFVYVSFGVPLTTGFAPPVGGFPGGLAAWSSAVDAVGKATPLLDLGGGGTVPILDLLLGTTAGSMGETCAVLILIGGAYLMYKKTANFRLSLGCVAGFVLLQGILWLAGTEGAADPLRGLLSGSILFGAMFMATDPVSASQTTNGGRWIYGLLIGALTSLIRTFSVWPEGLTFAILLANMFAPLLDHLLKERRKARQAKAEAAS